MDESSVAGRRVLVTGASGFLGSHLCKRLVAGGADVRAVSRVARSSADAVRWIKGDLANPGDARQILNEHRPDVVYHLAGAVTAAPGLELVEPVFTSLLVSTVNLLVAAAETNRPRVVLAGSLEEPQDPTAVPASPYAAAKAAAGAYGRMFNAMYHVPVVAVRPFMTYGPAQPASKVLPHVITSLLEGRAPRLGSGRRPLDWVYVDDVIEGMVRAATRQGVEGRTIDLGTGTQVTIREAVDTIVRLMNPAVQPIFDPSADRPFDPTRAADVEQARALLGWEAVTGLEEGLTRTIAWFREQRAART
jgi:nucleoside-diphosphate-sugar epimerase